MLNELGAEKTRELMSHYYGNLSLMSALLIAISFTIMIELEEDAPWSTSAVVTGIASFFFLLGCVVEAVFIDNSVTMCVTHAELSFYLTDHPLYLGWPTLLFILGLVMALLEFLLLVVSKFQVAIAIYTLTGGGIFILIAGSRFRQQSAWIGRARRVSAAPSGSSPKMILRRGESAEISPEGKLTASTVPVCAAAGADAAAPPAAADAAAPAPSPCRRITDSSQITGK